MISLQEQGSHAGKTTIKPPAPGAPAASHAATALMLSHEDGAEHKSAVRAIISRLSAATLETEALMRQSAEPEFGGFAEHEMEIKSITAALMDAADDIGGLTPALATALCEALPSLLPPDMIQRVIRSGLEAESEDFLDLLDCVRPPAGPSPLTTREESMVRLLEEIAAADQAAILEIEARFPGHKLPPDCPSMRIINKIGKVLAAVKGDAPHG